MYAIPTRTSLPGIQRLRGKDEPQAVLLEQWLRWLRVSRPCYGRAFAFRIGEVTRGR
jgi:hypothetical protein